MNNSKKLLERAKKIIPGGVHSPVRSFKSVGGEPLFFSNASGAHIVDVDGKTYIDFCQSFGPNILGHRHPSIQEKVEKVVKEVWTLGACDPYSLETAEWICKRLPWVEKIRFVCSGTEAVMTALRLARGYTGRSKILKFDGCYHGHVDSMLVKAGSGLAGESASDSKGVSTAVAAETLVASLGDIVQVEKLLAVHGSDIAAIIIEPIPANFGLLVQKTEFLKKLADLAKSNGSLLIFDEVISGFRVSMGGMAEVTGISPDLVTYGKVIGGGFPVGAVGGRSDIMDELAPYGGVYQAGTLAGNPVAMVAGLETLKFLESENVISTLNNRAQNFCVDLNQWLAAEAINVRVANFSSLFWFHSGQAEINNISQFSSSQGKDFESLFHACLDEGVYLAPSAFEVGFISWAHTEDVLQMALKKIKSAFKRRGEFEK